MQEGALTNLLGSFHRGLFVSLVALLFLVTAFYTLFLVLLQLAVAGDVITSKPLNLLNSAIALAVGVGMALVAVGLFRRARWSWPGALVASAAMVVLIGLQLLSGQAETGPAVVQLLLFAAIFALFFTDREIKALLKKQEPG